MPQATHQNEILLAEKILALIFKHRRQEDIHHICQKNCIDQYWYHIQKISAQINRKQKIIFILPAFPAKSPNPEKTASFLPDMGEKLALQFLNQLCNDISAIYTPGAEIIICSDGRVFNDLVLVSDKYVDAYSQGIRIILQENKLDNLSTFDLDECFINSSYENMRQKLIAEYGEALSSLKTRIKEETETRALFNGIHRFIFEDRLALATDLSKNKVRDQAKEVAYEVIQRSNAWSRLLERQFPEAVRLSIHPQVCHSEKIGIQLLQTDHAWQTPWHSVALYDGNSYRLTKRNIAETLQAKPIFINQQFSHYVI